MLIEEIVVGLGQDPRFQYHLSVEPGLVPGRSFAEQTRTVSRAGARGDVGEGGGHIYTTHNPSHWASQLAYEEVGEFPRFTYLVFVPTGDVGSAWAAHQEMNPPQDVIVLALVGEEPEGSDAPYDVGRVVWKAEKWIRAHGAEAIERFGGEPVTETRLDERIDSSQLQAQAYQAILDALRLPYNSLDSRLSEIQYALDAVASPYTAKWKGGVTNARGYQLDKISLMIKVQLSNRAGAAYVTKRLNTGALYGEMTVYLPHYKALEADPIPLDFASKLAASLADDFAHEMIHYTQEVQIKTLDPAKRSVIRNANALPLSDAESESITVERESQYLARKNEVDAYAANAASELARSLGLVSARRRLGDLAALGNHSNVVEKFVRLVKDVRPNAWRRFATQVAWNLERLSKQHAGDRMPG